MKIRNIKKLLKSILCLLLCLSMTIPAVELNVKATETTNLFANGTFADANSDGKADGWTYWFGSAAEASSSVGEDGLTITADSTNGKQRLTVHQTATVVSGKTYKLTGKYQVASTGSGSLEIRHNGTGTSERVAYHTSKTEGWKNIDHEFVASGTNVKLEIVVSDGATLTCSVDDISLVEVVTEPDPEPVPVDFVNGTFEDTDNDNKADDWQYYKGSNAEAPSEVTEEGLKITADSEADPQQQLYVHQTLSGFTAGHIYRFTGKYNISSYDEVANRQFIIRYVTNYEDNTKVTIEVVKHQNLTGGWLDFTKDIVIPQNMKNIKVEIVVNAGAGMTVTVDDFKLTKIQEAESFNNAGILKNPEFRGANAYNITNWAYSPDNKKAVTYSTGVDSENGLTLTANNTTGNMVVYQKITTGTDEVPEDAVYKLTGKMKAAAFAGSAFVRVRLDDEQGGSLSVVKQSPTITESTDGWVDVEFQFEVPKAYYLNAADTTAKNVGDFKVELYVGKGNAEKATGTVSFKDLAVTKVSDIEKNIVEGEANNSLFYNGGFERTYDGLPRWWNVWESTGGLKVSSDREVYHYDGKDYNGIASLHIENNEGGESRGSVHQTLTNIPAELQGQSVKISQWIKAKNFTGTGFTIRLQYKTNSGAAVDLTSKYVSIPENVPDTKWQKYEYILDLPSDDLSQIKFEYLYDECVGDIWVDDLSVTTYIKATGITSEELVVLEPGKTKDLSVNLIPEKTTEKSVSYVSSDTSVVEVNEGKLTAKAAGFAKVTISHKDGVKKEVAVLVTDDVIGGSLEVVAENKIQASVNSTATGELMNGYTYEVGAKPQYGAFVINGTGYTYYPDKDFAGEDSVVLLVTDNNNRKQALVKVMLNVSESNALPVFDDFIISTSVGKTVTGDLLATGSGTISYEITKSPSSGELSIVTTDSNGQSCKPYYKYEPHQDFDGGYVYHNSNKELVEVTATSTYNGVETRDTAKVTIYVAYSADKLSDDVKEFESEDHRGSYLLADDDKFEEIARLALTEGSEIADWLADVKAEVDALDYTKPFPAYQCSDGVRLDTQGSKDVVNLAFMYRVTKAMNNLREDEGEVPNREEETKYLNRAWMELENLCNPDKFPDWHPSHLLDVAMTANGVAIAYDWLYDYLDSDKINYVEAALYKNALQEGKFQYEDNHMFVTNGFNWNYVCNGGFATAALALMHCGTPEYEALAAEVLQLAYQSIQNGLPQYAPEGDSIEGVSYWDYGTRYLVSFLACVKSATGSNPFKDTPGLFETALYPIYLTGKDGSFNYSDNDTADAVGYLNLWLAEEYDVPAYAWYHKYYMSEDLGHKACIYDLLYYNAEYYNSDATPELDSYYSAQAVTTMRKDYTDPNSAFVGFKGGITGAPHGDLDIGTFIYDIYGIRWAADLGKENYNMGDYWNLNSGSLRWGYYRKDAAGHNTLVINPKKTGESQKIGTYTGAIETELKGVSGGYTILDMTPAYQHEAAEVKRGVAFINRSQMLVRDEYILKSAGEIYWQMHTEADISISSDGKIATLTKDGKSIEVRILDNADGLKFEKMAAGFYGKTDEADTRVDSSNAATGSADKTEKGRGRYTKLYIKAEDVQTGSFSVLLTPTDEVNPEVKPLADWDDYDFSKFVNNKKPAGSNKDDSSKPETEKEESKNETTKPSTGATLVETAPAPQKPASATKVPVSETKESDNSGNTVVPEEKKETVLKTEVTVTDNVVVVETPTEEALKEVLSEEAATDVVVIDLTETTEEVVAVEIPIELIEAVEEAAKDKDNTVDSLALKLPVGTVTMDAKTLKAVAKHAEGDSVRLVLEKETDHRLNEKQQEAVKDVEVHEFIEAYIVCAKTEKRISDFEGGVATLSIPFEIPAGKVAKGFSVWYVDDEGGMEKLNTWYEDGHIVWEVGHFSDFVIIYDEAAENATEEEVNDAETEDGAHVEEVVENNGFPWWIAVAVVVIAVIVVFFSKRKKEEGFED